jgi:type IV fimbrial biogenesis protein FimT
MPHRDEESVYRIAGRPPSRGFTFQEMLVTLTIGGILAAGTVSATHIVQENRLVSEVNQLMGQLALARIEAIKRRADVVVCPSVGTSHCMAPSEDYTSWHTGYMVFVDENGDGKKDGSEPVVYGQPPSSGGLVMHSSQARRKIVYQPDGTVTGDSNLKVTFCDSRGPSRAKAVFVLVTGRARLATRQSDGQPLTCPSAS